MLIAASLIASFNVLLGIASFLTRQKRKNWEQENIFYWMVSRKVHLAE